jgi:hypothetical protein
MGTALPSAPLELAARLAVNAQFCARAGMRHACRRPPGERDFPLLRALQSRARVRHITATALVVHAGSGAPLEQRGTGMSVRLAIGAASAPAIFVIHENSDWVEPLRREFAALGAPFQEWFLDGGSLDLGALPPEGIFYNRMSASSHTRGHRYAPELTGAVLAWLTRHGRRVVNGERALGLELSKVAQYQALAKFNVEVPATIAAVGGTAIAEAAAELGYPLILKHNRAGKGLGVKLIYSDVALRQHLANPDFVHSIDGIMLVQRYVAAPAPFITRVEFVGGRFLYAVRVDTSEGFELCPADACQNGDTGVCPTVAPSEKFQIMPRFEHPLLAQLAQNR